MILWPRGGRPPFSHRISFADGLCYVYVRTPTTPGNNDPSLDAVERLHGALNFPYVDLSRRLNTSEESLRRWRRGADGVPNPAHLERLQALHTFLVELDDLFVESKAARAWLRSSLTVHRGRTSRELIREGQIDCVTSVLYELNAGVAR